MSLFVTKNINGMLKCAKDGSLLVVKTLGPNSVCQKKNSRKNSDIATNAFETTQFISMENVNSFGQLTNDSNPIHKARENVTETPIVHGALLMSLVAGVMGSNFPGPGSIVISQEMRFISACPVNTNIKIEVKLKCSDGKDSSRRRKISDYDFSCSNVNDPSICYMKGIAKLLTKH